MILRPSRWNERICGKRRSGTNFGSDKRWIGHHIKVKHKSVEKNVPRLKINSSYLMAKFLLKTKKATKHMDTISKQIHDIRPTVFFQVYTGYRTAGFELDTTLHIKN